MTQGQEIHPDDAAVDRFAVELKAKLAEAREKGRGGWEDKAQVSAEALSEMLLAHVFKGDPRDVANFAMFLHQRGERIRLIGTPRHPAGAAGNVSWRADGEANAYFLMRNGNWLANVRMNGEMLVATQADLMHQIATALGQPDDSGAPFDLVAHLRRQIIFSHNTFGPGDRAAGVVDHIRKELIEIEADPSDLSEWIDVVLLALDGAWRQGYTPEQIVGALAAKQSKNEARTWPDWRTADPNKAIEHQKEGAATT